MPRTVKSMRHGRDDLAAGWPVPPDRAAERDEGAGWELPPDPGESPPRDRAGPISVAVLVLALVLAVAIVALV